MRLLDDVVRELNDIARRMPPGTRVAYSRKEGGLVSYLPPGGTPIAAVPDAPLTPDPDALAEVVSIHGDGGPSERRSGLHT